MVLRLVAALILLALIGCGNQAVPAGTAPLPPTDATEFMALLEGSDRPTVVNVWASWCIPCRSEAPLLERAHRQFGGEIDFVGINVADTQEAARSFVAEFDLSFENLFDPDRTVPAALGGSGVPLTFFFAPGGELVYFQPGVIDERTLALQVDELLRRTEPS